MDSAKILIVDDNRDRADGLATVLSGDGYAAAGSYTKCNTISSSPKK